jgi:hypothetical protein
MNRPDTDAQDQLSKSSFSACNARPVHTKGPLAINPGCRLRRRHRAARQGNDELGEYAESHAAALSENRCERCQSRGLRWYNDKRRSKPMYRRYLYIIERELGAHVARETARIIEYSRAQETNRREFPSIVIT